MNFIAHSVLALASVGVLAQCKSKETTEEAGNASGQSQPERTQHQTVDRPDSVSEGESYKDKKGLAMNRNEITHSLLTREKPEWLTIGSPVSAESFPEQGSGSEWKSVGDGKTVFSAGATVRRIGNIELPDSQA